MKWYQEFALYLTLFLSITNMIDINDVKHDLRDFIQKCKKNRFS